MVDEIVKLLREEEPNGYGLLHSAADLIEHLRARLHQCNEYALRLQDELNRRDCP